MSNEFEKKIENLFLKDQKIIDVSILENIIKNSILLKEQEKDQSSDDINIVTADDILQFLPKFEFTEDVGTVGTKSRTMFNMLINQKLASHPQLEDKIKYLVNFFGKATATTDTAELLSNIMLFKVLINIFRSSSPGSAGMQFESFIAGLIGGSQIKREVHLNVVDVHVGDKNYQIKALEQNGKVKMSYANLHKYFYKSDVVTPNKGSDLNLLVVEKLSGSSKNTGDIFAIKFSTGTFTKKDFKSMPQTEEFIIPSKYYPNDIGHVVISDSAMKQYSNLLEENMKKILIEVANLVNNINVLYLKNNTDAATAGIDNTKIIADVLRTKEGK